MITGRKCSACIITAYESKAEAIACCLMFFPIVFQVLPKLRSKYKIFADFRLFSLSVGCFRHFRSVFRVKNMLHRHGALLRTYEIVPTEWNFFTETHDENTLSVLRNKAVGVDYHMEDFITELFLQCSSNYLKSFTFIMAFQIFHILKKKSFRAFGCNNAFHIKKKSPLCVALKAMSATK